MTGKFKVENCFFGLVLPEEHVEHIRKEWGNETGDYYICTIPMSKDEERVVISHWAWFHYGTTLDFLKIEIFFKKRNVGVVVDEDFGYFLKWPDSTGYISKDKSQFSLGTNILKRMGLFHVDHKHRPEMESYKSLMELKKSFKILGRVK